MAKKSTQPVYIPSPRTQAVNAASALPTWTEQVAALAEIAKQYDMRDSIIDLPGGRVDMAGFYK